MNKAEDPKKKGGTVIRALIILTFLLPMLANFVSEAYYRIHDLKLDFLSAIYLPPGELFGASVTIFVIYIVSGWKRFPWLFAVFLVGTVCFAAYKVYFRSFHPTWWQFLSLSVKMILAGYLLFGSFPKMFYGNERQKLRL